MIPSPHTVEVIFPSMGTDLYGNDVETWDPPASTATVRGWLQQNQGNEVLTDGRAARSRSYLLMTSSSAALFTGRERVVWSGAPGGSLTFEVDGPGEPTYTLTGFHHTEVALRRVDG